MKEQENEVMNKYLEELQSQDWEELKRRKDIQKKLAVSFEIKSMNFF